MRTLAEAFRRTVDEHADRVAVRTLHDETSLTWAQLRDRADALSAKLAGLEALEELYLGQTRLGDAGVGHLSRLPRLAALYLGGCNVTDEGLEDLARLTNLEALGLMLAGAMYYIADVSHLLAGGDSGSIHDGGWA